MARNMSFAATIQQVENRTKRVTRRFGWNHLKPGDLLHACKKCMGIKPGESIERIGLIKVRSVTKEPLSKLIEFSRYGDTESRLEGFPELTGKEFVAWYCQEMGCSIEQELTRIEFDYVD